MKTERKQKTYYHVIEQFRDCYGWQGFFSTWEEAEKEKERLQNLFEKSNLYVHIDSSKREPNFITQ